jgi:hypothetical protein
MPEPEIKNYLRRHTFGFLIGPKGHMKRLHKIKCSWILIVVYFLHKCQIKNPFGTPLALPQKINILLLISLAPAFKIKKACHIPILQKVRAEIDFDETGYVWSMGQTLEAI